ncbi:hypothetical protein V7S43_013795 [Phytophthora oleae]|uniref:Uncharacterized protein n=1 Tax=Phytophthora oleae TaxID=2107226 RepID=A0ABD3F315_9STRA
MKELERGHTPAGIEAVMNDENKMNALSVLSVFGFPDDDDADSGNEQLHEKPEEWISGTGLRSASLWHWLHTFFSAEEASYAKKDA